MEHFERFDHFVVSLVGLDEVSDFSDGAVLRAPSQSGLAHGNVLGRLVEVLHEFQILVARFEDVAVRLREEYVVIALGLVLGRSRKRLVIRLVDFPVVEEVPLVDADEILDGPARVALAVGAVEVAAVAPGRDLAGGIRRHGPPRLPRAEALLAAFAQAAHVHRVYLLEVEDASAEFPFVRRELELDVVGRVHPVPDLRRALLPEGGHALEHAVLPAFLGQRLPVRDFVAMVLLENFPPDQVKYVFQTLRRHHITPNLFT